MSKEEHSPHSELPRSLQPSAGSIPPPHLEVLVPRDGARISRISVATARAKRLSAPFALAVAGALSIVTAAGLFASHQQSDTEAHVVSGKAGVRKTPSGVVERWDPKATLTFVLDGSLDKIGSGAKEAVRQAIGTWLASGVALPKVAFESESGVGKVAEDGVSRVVYQRITVKGHETDVAITIGYADAATGRLREADVIFNSLYAFGDLPAVPASQLEGEHRSDDDAEGAKNGASCGGKYDLQNVATHESGHVFGLGEDFTNTSATMYFHSQPCQTHKRVLAPDDVGAMSGVYGLTPKTPAPNAGSPKAPPTAGATATGAPAQGELGGGAADPTPKSNACSVGPAFGAGGGPFGLFGIGLALAALVRARRRPSLR